MNLKVENNEITKIVIDNIPICYCKPEKSKGIVLWIPYLGGTKESCINELSYLASNSFIGITLDPWMQGERSDNTKPSVRTKALKEFRNTMWQILGITTLDCFKVLDWAISEFEIDKNIYAGGLSMGGDIALALAGIDERINRVSAVAAAPDWYRDGMTDVLDSTKIIRQGESTHFSAWLCSQLNPMKNVTKYNRDLSIYLEYGKADTHISFKWAEAFRSEIEKFNGMKGRIKIVCNEDSTHISLIQKKSVIKRALDFLIE